MGKNIGLMGRLAYMQTLLLSMTVITWYYVIQMLQTLKDPTVIGSYDTIAAYADNDAVDFFKRNGFTDDVVLCSRFR